MQQVATECLRRVFVRSKATAKACGGLFFFVVTLLLLPYCIVLGPAANHPFLLSVIKPTNLVGPFTSTPSSNG